MWTTIFTFQCLCCAKGKSAWASIDFSGLQNKNGCRQKRLCLCLVTQHPGLLIPSFDPCKHLSGGENDRMSCTSCNVVPGRECSDCHSLTAVCRCSTGPHAKYLWNLERSYFPGLPLLRAGWVRRNQILWGALIFRHTSMWGQLLRSRCDCQACQRKQSNAMYGPMCKRE